jgi:hypothetical protein
MITPKQNPQEIAKQATDALSKLLKIQDANLSQLPQEAMEKVAPHRAKMEQIMKSVREGDFDKLTQLAKGHADTD